MRTVKTADENVLGDLHPQEDYAIPNRILPPQSALPSPL